MKLVKLTLDRCWGPEYTGILDEVAVVLKGVEYVIEVIIGELDAEVNIY